MEFSMIISASRRTDIPAFYGKWVINRLREGYCNVSNPFNPHQISIVELTPEKVDAIVFWSKNPAPFIQFLPELEKHSYRYYFLFTLNPYPPPLEGKLPTIQKRIETFRTLASKIGNERVIWRYDPLILSSIYNTLFHLKAFSEISENLHGACTRVIISVVDFYRKTECRLKEIEKITDDNFERMAHSLHETVQLVQRMAKIAERSGIQLQTCCESVLANSANVPDGKCIDDELIHRIFGIKTDNRKDPGQRPECKCVVSCDIGATDTCQHYCAYCYAVTSFDTATRRAKQHNSADAFLVPRASTPAT